MSENEYPEEIYDHRLYGSYRRNSNGSKMVELAYDLGKKHAQGDAGDWYNLSASISAGEPIDWEKLDGRRVKFTNGKTSIEDILERDEENCSDSPGGWNCTSFTSFMHSWRGDLSWTLYLDGEIPMKKQTAEQLPFGTHFRGVFEKNSSVYEFVKVANDHIQSLQTGRALPSGDVEVVEVLGMYGEKESE